ncbi:fibronectin type III-like domain-contianing protein [Streptomyces sp. NPDC058877]|uniref:fibronectin type III-like domain-contianing protein n=1 Tax=unclassified Streptomyces TaxID=2593676 RepID=UPI00368E1C30
MVTLTNTGSRPGREVVQAYLETPAVPGDPLRVLAGFAVAEIAAGNTATITVAVPWRAFHHRDEAAGRWRPRTGRHRLRIGRSSRDPRLALALDVLPGARGAGHVLRFVP